MEGVEGAALPVANTDEENRLRRANMTKIRTKKKTIS